MLSPHAGRNTTSRSSFGETLKERAVKKESAKARSTSKKITSRSDPYQRYKMAAIPVLLLVLGYVMFGGGKSENKPLVLSTLAGNASKPNAPGPTPNKKQPLIWEEPNLDFISRVNPLISYRTKPELPVLEPVKEVPPVSVAPKFRSGSTEFNPTTCKICLSLGTSVSCDARRTTSHQRQSTPDGHRSRRDRT